MLVRTLCVISVLTTLACGGAVPAPGPPAPAPPASTQDPRLELVEGIYRGYAMGRPPELREMPWTREIDGAFAALLAKDELGLGFDPLIGGQDFEIDRVQVTLAPDGRVEAAFRNFGQPMVVRWTLVEEEGGLRIADLDTADGTLRTMLGL